MCLSVKLPSQNELLKDCDHIWAVDRITGDFKNHCFILVDLAKDLCFHQDACRNTNNCSPGLWTITRTATTIFEILNGPKEQGTILLTASKEPVTDSLPHFFQDFSSQILLLDDLKC